MDNKPSLISFNNKNIRLFVNLYLLYLWCADLARNTIIEYKTILPTLLRSTTYNTLNVSELVGFFNANEIGSWDVSGVTDMSNLFYDHDFDFNVDVLPVTLKQQIVLLLVMIKREMTVDLSGWNVSNVKNMSHMFHNAMKFNCDLSKWDVSNVTDMSHMFHNAFAFQSNIGKWNISNVTNMSHMFYNASQFNRQIIFVDWKPKVNLNINMKDMFYRSAPTNKSLSQNIQNKSHTLLQQTYLSNNGAPQKLKQTLKTPPFTPMTTPNTKRISTHFKQNPYRGDVMRYDAKKKRRQVTALKPNKLPDDFENVDDLLKDLDDFKNLKQPPQKDDDIGMNIDEMLKASRESELRTMGDLPPVAVL